MPVLCQSIQKIIKHGRHARKPGHFILGNRFKNQFCLESFENDHTSPRAQTPEKGTGDTKDMDQGEDGDRDIVLLESVILGNVRPAKTEITVRQDHTFGLTRRARGIKDDGRIIRIESVSLLIVERGDPTLFSMAASKVPWSSRTMTCFTRGISFLILSIVGRKELSCKIRAFASELFRMNLISRGV